VTITHIGTGAQVAGITTTLTPTYPAAYTAIADDCCIIAMAGRHGGAGDPATPTNWTRLGFFEATTITENPACVFFGRILTAGMALPAFNISTWDTAGRGASVQSLILRGTDLSSPFSNALDGAAVGQAVADSDGFGTKTPNAYTTASNDSWILQMACSVWTNALVLSNANGWTSRMSGANYDTATGGVHAMGLATIEKATAGAQTSPEWQQSVDAWNDWCFLTIAIKAAGGGGGIPTTTGARWGAKG
jgi:hypothetical protein